MSSRAEAAIRGVITSGIDRIAAINRSMARPSGNGPHPYLSGLHEPMTEEVTLESLSVTGEIPAALDGRYLRIGPNPAGPVNPARYHWFAGDGMVHGVRIKDGQALWYRNRWVRSTSVSRSLGETPKPGPRLAEFAVNTNVIGHADQFFALVEAGANPVELDGMAETVRHSDFDGTLGGAFSAHPHRDPDSGELHAICYDARKQDAVHHVVVGTDGRVRRREPVAVQHGPSIHDCAITARFVIIMDLPVTFSIKAYASGWSFPYRWNPEHKARLGLLPREAPGTETIWCDADPCYIYHPCNAYDRADGCVVLDVAVHDRNGHRDYRGPDADAIAFERWVIDPTSRRITRAVIDASPQEFPRMNETLTGKEYRYAYCLAVPDADQSAAGLIGQTRLLKHDLRDGTRQVHDFGARHYPGEFVFVPKPGAAAEDDGWLMGLVVDMARETTDLAILDAARFEEAPVARITLPHRVPPGFHGNWVPSLPAPSGAVLAG